MRLLIIEDDLHFGQSLTGAIRKNYSVDWAKNAREGLSYVTSNDYDLIILDLGLPDLDGIEVCRKMRSLEVTSPIIILTGQFNKINDKIAGLDCGADDYMTKPIELNELYARIRALLRRLPLVLETNILSAGDLTLDLDQRAVSRNNQKVMLRRKEFDLLEYLLRNQNRVVTRTMILEHVWDGRVDLFTNAIDVHIKYLRDKIDRPFDDQLIKTVHGFGYKIENRKGGDKQHGALTKVGLDR